MSKKKPTKKKTKHGFAVLSDRDDLEKMWSADKKFNKASDMSLLNVYKISLSPLCALWQEKKRTEYE